MASLGRVVHFEIGADDPARAKKFYEDAFGWELQDVAGAPGMEGVEYWTIMTEGEGWEEKKKSGEHEIGIDGGLFRRQSKDGAPDGEANAYRCVVGVEDIDEAIKKVKAAGGKTFGEKLDIPGVGTYIMARDTENNQLSLLQPLPREQ